LARVILRALPLDALVVDALHQAHDLDQGLEAQARRPQLELTLLLRRQAAMLLAK
jgi:hypothetical protein